MTPDFNINRWIKYKFNNELIVEFIIEFCNFEEALHGFFSSEKPELEKAINETGDWNDDIEKKFTEIVEQFKKTQTF